MLPPKASGTSTLRASNAAGATPMVPWKGSSGKLVWYRESSAWNWTLFDALSTL
jgi:hypothetical protein